MSTTYLQDVKAKIVAIVQGVTNLTGVYTVETPAVDTYPYATVVLTEQDGEYLDTANNLIRLVFRIRVYFERVPESPTTLPDNETAVMRVLDELVKAFNDAGTLTGTVAMVEVAKGVMGYASVSNGNARIVEVDVTCKKLVPVV